jgi:hypothetical protein
MWWCREVEGNKVEGFLSLALNQKIEKPDLHFANRVFCFRAIVIAVGGTTKQSYCGRYTRSKIALPKIQESLSAEKPSRNDDYLLTHCSQFLMGIKNKTRDVFYNSGFKAHLSSN